MYNMKTVSNGVKNALKQPTTQRKGRVLINDKYYEVYNVEYYADAYDNGNVIGNAIASQLDFDIPYISKFDSFKYFDGVWTGFGYEYVDMGIFTVFDEKDEDEFTKHITAFDNLIKFNAPFIDKGSYPKTLYQELLNICEQADVSLLNTSIPNGDFIVENNQFVNGESLKTVLKNICGVSGTYGIVKNDKLVLQLRNKTNEVMNKSQHEPMIWKRKTYGINQVILGMTDVEGEYVLRQDAEDIALNGVHKLVINDNLFAYTQEKREQLIDKLFEQVKGFGYVPYELKGEWLNYLEIGDTITIDEVETIVLRIQGNSPKSLESIMSAPSIIDSAVDYANNTNDIENRLKSAEIKVDKATGEVSQMATSIDKLSGTVNSTELSLTNQQARIDVLSSNIDPVTGEITSVKTGKGFTFDDRGLNINDPNEDFNTLITNRATQYKNGDEVITETSKDGFMTTDLKEKGTHKYSWNGSDYDMVAERIEVEGEYAYAHFYNGGDV